MSKRNHFLIGQRPTPSVEISQLPRKWFFNSLFSTISNLKWGFELNFFVLKIWLQKIILLALLSQEWKKLNTCISNKLFYTKCRVNWKRQERTQFEKRKVYG